MRVPHRPFPVILAFPVLIALVLSSCGNNKTTVSPAKEATVPQVAFISFMSGSVQYSDGNEWKDASIGQFLPVGTGLRTEGTSSAEIQISDKASVLVLENSAVTIQNLTGPRYSVELEAGTVIASVAKLADGERFKITAGNNILAAHGSRFMVNQDKETQVSVHQGEVSVLPTGIDPSDLVGLTTDPKLRGALQKLGDSAVTVQAGQELSLKPEIGSTEKSVLSDVSNTLNQIKTDQKNGKKDSLSGTKRDLLSSLLTYVGQKVEQELPPATGISPDARSEIEKAGALKLLPVPSSQSQADLAQSGLASITIRTAPEDAEIFLGDRDIGKKIFSGLFPQGQKVTFVIRRKGYESKSIEVTFSHDLNQTVTVTLDKRKPAYDAQTFLSAVSRGNLAVIDRYLDTGGNPNVRLAGGLPAIALALGADHASPVKLEISAIPKVLDRLLQAGADPNMPFSFGGQQLTPLYLVLASGLSSNRVQFDLVDTLLKAGADPNVYVQNGDIQVNALSMAIIVGLERKTVNYELLQKLLKFGANPNAVMMYQGKIMTPLVASVVIGAEFKYVDLKLVELLVKNGAEINGRVNIDGQIGTPLYFSDKYGFTKVSDLLKQYGAVK